MRHYGPPPRLRGELAVPGTRPLLCYLLALLTDLFEERDGEACNPLDAPQAPESFWPGRLYVHRAFCRRAEPFHHDLTYRSDTWRLAHERAVRVDKVQSGLFHECHDISQDLETVCSGPARVRIGKMGTEIAKSGSTEYRVRDRVRDYVGIAVALESALSLETDPSEHQDPPQASTGREPVLVKTRSDSQCGHRLLHLSAIVRSSGEVSFKLVLPRDDTDAQTEGL